VKWSKYCQCSSQNLVFENKVSILIACIVAVDIRISTETDFPINMIVERCIALPFCCAQAREQHGTPGEAKSFLRGAQMF